MFSCTGDRVLRYIHGEWKNVSAKCKREKNLGYYENDNADYADRQDDDDASYAYDMEIEMNDDDDDHEEEDCALRFHNNRRPDLFWIGDGFHKHQARPRHRPERVSMRQNRVHHRHHHGDGFNHDDMLNRYPAHSPINWIKKKVYDDENHRSVRLPFPITSLSMNRPPHKGYHPYAQPMPPVATTVSVAPAAAPASCHRIHGIEPTQIAVSKCCCCENKAASMVNQMQAMPSQWQVPSMQKPSTKNESIEGSSKTVTNPEQKFDEPKTMVENSVQTDAPESASDEIILI